MPELQDSFSHANNPLINPPPLPYGAPPFNLVKTEHMMPAIDFGIAQAKANIEAIKALPPEQATFANTIEAYERYDRKLDWMAGIAFHIIQTNGTDEQRTLMKDMLAKMSTLETDVAQDENLFARIKSVYDTCDRKTLSGEQVTLLEKIYKNFVRDGALLTEAEHPAEKKRLREINEELARRTADFSDRVTNATGAYERYVDDVNELAGVPERALKQFAHQAVEKGQPGRYLIQLEPYPSDIMTHCTNRALRKEITDADNSICDGDAFDNKDNILNIVRLRNEMAQLVGYPNYASYVVADRMTGDTQTVMNFLEKNLSVYKPAAEKELEEIKAFALRTDGLTDVQPWDMGYYSRALKEEKFNMTTEELRPYFELNNVLDGLRQHAEKLFDIEMREEKSGKYPVHHPDVKVYEIYDNKTHDVRGVFYADYYARRGAKKGGAWHNGLRTYSVDENGEVQIPINSNTCNFPKPAPGQPTLLSPGEVKTIFHEFGHGLHCLLGEGRYASLTGTKVKRDFVELPSQLQEHWALSKEVLDTFAKHYQTGEPIPAKLVQTLNDMKNFGAGRMGLGQTFYALLDMAWYTADPATITNVADFEQTIADRATLFPHARGLMSPTFSHIFSGGYAAGYHGYKWAETLDNDVFGAFQKNGLYDRETAERLRETIYSKGGTANPMDLFVAMMGRKPDPDALLRSEGLLPPAASNDNLGSAPQKLPHPGPAFGMN